MYWGEWLVGCFKSSSVCGRIVSDISVPLEGFHLTVKSPRRLRVYQICGSFGGIWLSNEVLCLLFLIHTFGVAQDCFSTTKFYIRTVQGGIFSMSLNENNILEIYQKRVDVHVIHNDVIRFSPAVITEEVFSWYTSQYRISKSGFYKHFFPNAMVILVFFSKIDILVFWLAIFYFIILDLEYVSRVEHHLLKSTSSTYIFENINSGQQNYQHIMKSLLKNK